MAESAACVSTVFSADHPMCETYSDFLPLRAVTVSADGKRRYDEGDKQRLIEACLQAGVLVAGMALRAGVNANQLRRWIGKHKAKQKDAAAVQVLAVAPVALVPVMEITDGNGANCIDTAGDDIQGITSAGAE
jgi:hypothetical protein